MAQILLLEDDRSFGFLLKVSLEEAGHSVVVRQDATMAFAEFQKNTPDVVIADLIVVQEERPIPDGGLSLIARIRHRGNMVDRSVPIIAISGVVRSQGLESALDTAKVLGADASLEKPFAPAELLDLISELTSDVDVPEDRSMG